MVGYDKDDKLTANHKLIAGCVAGALTRFLTQPLDIIKLRSQLQKVHKSPHRYFKITRLILKEEGITAFWLGHNLGQIHSMLALSCQFYVYEHATKVVADIGVDKKYQPISNFLSGVVSGCVGSIVVSPLEVTRVRQMLTKEQYKGIWRGAREVYRNGGFFAFYEGLWASMLQMGPAVGVSFAVFSFVQPRILSLYRTCDANGCAPSHVGGASELMVATTIGGIAAGLVSKTVTYPFDLAKRRMQIKSHKSSEVEQKGAPSTTKDLMRCTSLISCIRQMYHDAGVRGLFQGWKVTMYKAQATSIISFTVYELMCYFLRQL